VPFLLFLLGDSIEQVAETTGTPADVMYLTAIKYCWPQKRDELAKMGQANLIAQLQKHTLNKILVATSMVIDKQLKDVISGKLPAEKCSLIPRNIHGLGALMEMITAANQEPPAPQPPAQTTVVQATNVQINQQAALPEKPDRMTSLKALAGESDE
jgi:hypothetical protein